MEGRTIGDEMRGEDCDGPVGGAELVGEKKMDSGIETDS